MPARETKATAKSSKPRKRETAASLAQKVQDALAWLDQNSTRQTLDGMARYAIPSHNALGVPMATMQKLAKQLGTHQKLALALWETGCYEARTVAAFVADPAVFSSLLMDQWCDDFDSWAICDTVCFKLFDQLPHAFDKVEQWSHRKNEFGKRAAFALLACLALHDKQAKDELFLGHLPLLEQAACDERNFVKKGVLWAYRAIGGRSLALHTAVLAAARRLSSSSTATARSLGKEVLRELPRPALQKRLAAKDRPRRST